MPRWRLFPAVRLPRLWKLPEVKLPQIDLPRVRVDFPEEVVVPWKEMEIEKVEFMPLNPRGFKVIFRRIPVTEREA